MADISEVLDAVRDAAAAALAAVGLVQPSQTHAGTRIYVGWPEGNTLDADLKVGVAHVTVWPRTGMARNVGPYLTGWSDRPGPAPSMTATVADDAATFAGTGATPSMIAAVIVDRAGAYTYPLQAGDGPQQVASALAALVAVDRPASATGAVLSVPGAFSLAARVVAGGTESKEMRRVAQSIQISVWASKPTIRDRLSQAIDLALEEQMRTVLLPDGSKARIAYEGTGYEEDARQQPLHRRDLFVSAEFSLSVTRAAPGIAVPTAPLAVDPTVTRRVIIS